MSTLTHLHDVGLLLRMSCGVMFENDLPINTKICLCGDMKNMNDKWLSLPLCWMITIVTYFTTEYA